MKPKLTDEQVEEEITRLKASSSVKLAVRERDIKNRRRRYMGYLRRLESRGEELKAQGITYENMEVRLFGSVTELPDEEA